MGFQLKYRIGNYSFLMISSCYVFINYSPTLVFDIICCETAILLLILTKV